MTNGKKRTTSYSNIKEKVFSEYIDEKIEKILNFSEKENEIHSVLAIGSLGKRSMRHYSNLNLILVTDLNSTSIYEELKKLFFQKLIYAVKKSNKLLFYLNFISVPNDKTFELEIQLIKQINDLHDIFLGSDFIRDDITNIILLDKNDYVKTNLLSILQKNEAYKNNLSTFFIKTHDDFIEYFIEGCMNLNKTDLYQYYNYMVKCYSELLKLEALVQNNLENLTNPVFALVRLDFRSDWPFYKKNIPNLSLSDKNLRVEYVNRFLYLTKLLGQRYALELPISETEKILNKVLKESYFWNLRDISYLDLQHLKKGVFYRSSTLSRYSEQPELNNFLSNNNIKTIIDLRSKPELPYVPYKNIDQNIIYVNIPIGDKDTIDFSQLKYSTPNKDETFYEVFLRFYKEEIKQTFESLAKYEPGFVLHCYAGRDRTGIIITEELIIEDYLNSGNNTDLKTFNVFKSTLKEYGGSKSYLKSIGLNQESIERIINKFVID